MKIQGFSFARAQELLAFLLCWIISMPTLHHCGQQPLVSVECTLLDFGYIDDYQTFRSKLFLSLSKADHVT